MMKYEEEKKYVGNRDQLIRARRMEMREGKADGVEMIDIQNHSGMHFCVNVSRGMDIPYLDFLGENYGFISPCGIVAPEYFDDKGLGFLKSFTAGFLTTCGLKSAGAPSEYEGTAYGLHGNISHTPAEEVTCVIEEEGLPNVKITGKMRDAVVFGDKLVLEREIKCGYKERKISIRDKVVNEGFLDARHMMIYHCNFGYPLLTPESEIFIPSEEVKARTTHAKDGIDRWMSAELPDPDYEEMCYYHTLKQDANHQTAVAIFNDELGMGAALEFDVRTLDYLVQWKMMGAGDYVMGLEPCNSTIDGIEDAVKNGSMKYIKPGDCIEHSLTIHILNSREELEEIKDRF